MKKPLFLIVLCLLQELFFGFSKLFLAEKSFLVGDLNLLVACEKQTMQFFRLIAKQSPLAEDLYTNYCFYNAVKSPNSPYLEGTEDVFLTKELVVPLLKDESFVVILREMRDYADLLCKSNLHELWESIRRLVKSVSPITDSDIIVSGLVNLRNYIRLFYIKFFWALQLTENRQEFIESLTQLKVDFLKDGFSPVFKDFQADVKALVEAYFQAQIEKIKLYWVDWNTDF